MTKIAIPPKLDAERKELMRLQREKDMRQVALPRTFSKPGVYTGQDLTKAFRREGSMALDQAPSLYSNTLVYKNGTTQEYKK